MRFAVIENGSVVNVVLAASADALGPDVTLINTEEAEIGDTWDGAVFSRPPMPLAEAKAQALAEIDRQAETERLKYITEGQGQAMVYVEKAAQAVAYTADANPADTDYPLLKAEADALGETLNDVAQSVLATKAIWLGLAQSIEGIRLVAKKAVGEATTTADVKAAMDTVTWPG